MLMSFLGACLLRGGFSLPLDDEGRLDRSGWRMYGHERRPVLPCLIFCPFRIWSDVNYLECSTGIENTVLGQVVDAEEFVE